MLGADMSSNGRDDEGTPRASPDAPLASPRAAVTQARAAVTQEGAEPSHSGGLPADDPFRRADPAVVVRFRIPGDAKVFDRGDLTLARHTRVLVQSDGGHAVGTVLRGTDRRLDAAGSVLRIANAQDDSTVARNRDREREAFLFCSETIAFLRLPMKLMKVEVPHSQSRAIFYFTSGERVDFRTLVKTLAQRLHTRIEMRQIGVRDASRHVGGVGICGRELCCSTWLPQFKPISIRMAKDQGLSLNHDKLSGLCGRLRCCLGYEQKTYQEKRKRLPKMGKRVLTPSGEGRVRDVDVLAEIVRVELTGGGCEEFAANLLTAPPDQNPMRKRQDAAGDRSPSVANEPFSSSAPSAASPAAASPPATRREGGGGEGRGSEASETETKPEKRRHRHGRRRQKKRGPGPQGSSTSS